MPASLKPMLATRKKHPFSHPDWLYEVKWDGVRALCFVRGGSVGVQSRNLRQLDRTFPEVAEYLLNAVPESTACILDGEITAFEDQRPSFQRIQRRLQVTSPSKISRLRSSIPVSYIVFDILYLAGHSLLECPLKVRRELLDSTVTPNEVIKNPAPVPAQGEALYRAAAEKQLEGIVAKNMLSTYGPGTRTSAWVKFKVERNLDAVVGGFTRPQGARKRFGALLLGLYSNQGLRYVGHTGTGFNQETIEQVFRRMKPLITPDCPFRIAPRTNTPATWLEPRLVAEITCQEITSDGKLRIPVFKNLRDDKDPAECRMASEMGAGYQAGYQSEETGR
jgi:bifunctional non-homologous end joining protein LigD